MTLSPLVPLLLIRAIGASRAMVMVFVAIGTIIVIVAIGALSAIVANELPLSSMVPLDQFVQWCYYIAK